MLHRDVSGAYTAADVAAGGDGVKAVVPVIAVIVSAFWILVAGGMMTRIVVAVVHRKPHGLARSIFGPIFGAGAVQSKAFGWTPSSPEDVEWPKDLAQDRDTTEPK